MNKNLTQEKKDYQNKILTAPNLLSVFRLLLIPIIVLLYANCHFLWALLVLIISGISDIADGIIARKFNMVSNFGKALDPIADKLTQLSVICCICYRFHHMVYLADLLIIKEILAGIVNLSAIRKTKKVMSSEWHGKLTTVSLYAVLSVHLVWANIPTALSVTLEIFCAVLMVLSSVLYTTKYLKVATRKKEKTK